MLSKDGSIEIGKICKKWSHFIQECFTYADIFAIIFRVDLEFKLKATLLGALFMMNLMYCENQTEYGSSNIFNNISYKKEIQPH